MSTRVSLNPMKKYYSVVKENKYLQMDRCPQPSHYDLTESILLPSLHFLLLCANFRWVSSRYHQYHRRARTFRHSFIYNRKKRRIFLKGESNCTCIVSRWLGKRSDCVGFKNLIWLFDWTFFITLFVIVIVNFCSLLLTFLQDPCWKLKSTLIRWRI